MRATRSVVLVLVVACVKAAEPNASEPSATQSGSESEGSGLTCWSAPPEQAVSEGIRFSDQTDEYQLVAPLTGMYGHAVVWADITGDDLLDLYVGTFADRDAERYQYRGAEGPSPDRLLIQADSEYAIDTDLPDMFSRTAGGTVADLDRDGDLDLIISRNYRDKIAGAAPTQILRNDGGHLTPIDDTGLPPEIGGRSVGVIDFDEDGFLDLFIVEDRWSGGSSVMLRNEGGLRFSDVTAAIGLPGDVHGLGVAVADFNDDGHLDFFVSGSNRMFVSTGDASFVEVDTSVFQWEYFGEEDDVAGVSVGDVNRDGRLDIVVGHHFNSTVDDGTRVAVRLYLNRGVDEDGEPLFEDVTEEAGLPGLSTKAPHVEINDFDNDGWPDILTSASAESGSTVAVFRNEGLRGSIPIFSSPVGMGSKQYWVAAPSGDFDRDGRLDLFLLEWEPALPSLLMHNDSSSGHWLEVSVGAELGFGIGWRVEVFEGSEVDGALLGARDITVTQGYSAGVAPTAHFGLGEVTVVTVRLTSPGGQPVVLSEVSADQHMRYPSGCGG